MPENYPRDMLYGPVNDAFVYSAAILDNDYYAAVLPTGSGAGMEN